MAVKNRSAARIRRHIRVRKKVSGTPECPRLSVFRSLNGINVQIIDDQNSHTLASASNLDADLRKQLNGKTKTEQAQIIGQTVAEKAKSKGITKVVFDRGGYRYIGRVKAVAEGAREGGLQF